jgi:tetratricopeptide (TPR) repeat protein
MLRTHQEIPMQRPHPVRACTLLGLALFALSGPARAQQPAAPDATQPPAAQYRLLQADERFAEGARLFKQWRFDEAEQKFREALIHWEDPLIHLYLSRALEKQGRLVEAHEALQPALRPGVESLPPEDVQVAEDLRQSLESRLAQIEVSCDVPGAEVSLDGEPWFTAPGRQLRMITAGQHVLIARKAGYFPVTEPVSLLPGKQTRIVLRMTADVVHVERRWQPWQPWAVAGSGFAVSLAGGLFLWQARSDYGDFRKGLAACKREPCDPITLRPRDSGVWKEYLGTGALITGGTVLVTGLAGVLLNQSRTRRSEPARGVELELAPLISGDTAGISIGIRF